MRTLMSHYTTKKKKIRAETDIQKPPKTRWLPEISCRRNQKNRDDNDPAVEDTLETFGLVIHWQILIQNRGP